MIIPENSTFPPTHPERKKNTLLFLPTMFATTIRHLTRQTRRNYVTTAQAFNVFDRKAKLLQKDRAASNIEESRTVDYLKDEIAARVADRLLVLNKKNWVYSIF